MLKEIAAVYEVTGENRFRMLAYQRSADAVEHAASEIRDLWENRQLDEIPGIGKTIAAHLEEYFRTGKVRHFEFVKQGMPRGMFEFLRVPGIGPKTAYKIALELKIKTVRELKKAAESGKIAELPGLGEKSQADIIRSITELENRPARLLLSVASDLAEEIIGKLRSLPGTSRVDAMGSLRRRVSTVGDIDIAAATTKPAAVIETFTKMREVARVLLKGERKASVRLKNGVLADLRVQSPASYGAQLQYFTGSKEHNIRLRTLAQGLNFSLSEYGLKETQNKNGTKNFASEDALYRELGLDWIPPELREGREEIEAARQGKLPKLVALGDIKGDLHVHCNFPLEESHDSGSSTLAGIALEALQLNYEYVSLGNHSPSIAHHTPGAVKNLIQKKIKATEAARKQFPKLALLNVVEVDILSNGRLALDEASLKMFDLVIAGVHSSFRQDQKTMTGRVVAALKNPYVKVLAHPTGRLLLTREGYDLDWALIFKTCLQEEKILEINAYPSRLDLPDTLVREAVRLGVSLIINTDAHEASQMKLMRYGVDVARRGWCEKKNVVNTLSWADFRARLGLKLSS